MIDAEYLRKLNKLYWDMYEGDGRENPSVTARLAVLEEKVDKITGSLGSLKLWALGIIGTVLADAAVHLLKH